MRIAGRLAVLLLLVISTTLAADFKTERVFGPEVPTGPYKHPASISEFANGDLYIVYYGGKGEYANDTSVYGSRLKKGSTQWSAPRVIAHDPFRSVGNGVVWQAPDGVVWLFYVVRFGKTWSDSRIGAKISTDNAETWSDASLIDLQQGSMVRCHPILLANGDYLLPVYRETGNDPELVAPDSGSYFLRYDVKAKTWTKTNEIRSRIGNIQPAAARVTDSYLVAYCRRGGTYEPRKDGYLVRSESRDGGKTWSAGTETKFPNPNSAVDFIRLKNGHLLLVYNDSMNSRTPLTAAISEDGDKTYPFRRNLAEGRNDFAYPAAIQTADGMIHVVYTSDRRGVIHHTTFSEEWVKQTKR
ncbi:MAG: sialidase family protein [Bryobacteraceae bacterium]